MTRLSPQRLAYLKRYRTDNKDRVAAAIKKCRDRSKLDVLTHYSGGEPRCGCCGDIHTQFLTIDHADGNGADHRREIFGESAGRGGYELYVWLKRNEYPDGFRVLCFNCNFATHAFGVCPHQQKA